MSRLGCSCEQILQILLEDVKLIYKMDVYEVREFDDGEFPHGFRSASETGVSMVLDRDSFLLSELECSWDTDLAFDRP